MSDEGDERYVVFPDYGIFWVVDLKAKGDEPRRLCCCHLPKSARKIAKALNVMEGGK